MMKVRLANASDGPALLDMGRCMHAESRFSAYPLDMAKLQQVVDISLNEPRVHCIVVAEKAPGVLVGMLGGHVLTLFFTDVRIAQDKFYYVRPEHRGSSAALKLLTAFQRWALNRKAREININMSVSIEAVRFERFMQHVGYVSCGSNYYRACQ